jgi:protein-S-isoprenylcysteine O-methyltransferase Ste14
MRPLATHDLSAILLVWGSVVLWFVVESVVKARARAGAETRTAPEWSYFFIAVVFFASLALGAVAARHDFAPLPGGAWWPVIAGVALIWAGSVLRVWSILALGQFFKLMVVIQEHHQVVDRGPYRRLRHPAYLGSILVMSGIGLSQGGWVGTIVMAVGVIVAFVIRIRFEERVLLGALGDEYAAYTRRTARLVPGVY